MRIALLTDGIFPYVIGGMQKHSYFLVKYFTQNQIHVDIYHVNSSKYDINKLEFFSAEEKKFIRSFVFEFPVLVKIPGHYSKESYQFSELLYEIYKEQQPVDFIYAKGYTGWKFMEEKKKGAPLPPIGVRLHGYEIYQPTNSFKVKIWNFIYRKTFIYNNINADYIYSYGGKITQLIQENLKIKKDKIIEIPTAIEANWVKDTPASISKKRKFIFIGRYDIRKGIKELNQALEKIKDNASFEFHFIGPIIKKFQLQLPAFIYHGLITAAEEIKKIVSECDVLVLPSHSEGMPNVIMEAMASGCAIIATDVGAISLMVDESNGWLIKPFNSQDILDTILIAINKEEKDLLAMKNASIAKVKNNFLWENVIHLEIDAINNSIRNEAR